MHTCPRSPAYPSLPRANRPLTTSPQPTPLRDLDHRVVLHPRCRPTPGPLRDRQHVDVVLHIRRHVEPSGEVLTDRDPRPLRHRRRWLGHLPRVVDVGGDRHPDQPQHTARFGHFGLQRQIDRLQRRRRLGRLPSTPRHDARRPFRPGASAPARPRHDRCPPRRPNRTRHRREPPVTPAAPGRRRRYFLPRNLFRHQMADLGRQPRPADIQQLRQLRTRQRPAGQQRRDHPALQRRQPHQFRHRLTLVVLDIDRRLS